MRRSALVTLALLIAVASSLVASTAPAIAEPLSVTSVGGFVADGVHQRVFVGDRTAGKVLAADYDGNLVDSTSGISGVADLALSADSQVLYAASRDTHEIVALDPATLDEIARYTVATTDGPRSLAFAGGKIWFSYGDQWSGNLGSIAPSTGTVTMDQYPGRLWGQALLDSATGKPDLLAVGQASYSSSDVMAVLDVSGAPSEVAWGGTRSLNTGIGDIDLSPEAPQVLVNGRYRQAYADGLFSASGTYTSGYTSRYAADISSTGIVATADDTQVKIFRPNVSLPVNTFPVNAAALAWAPDDSRLFVLTGTLSVIDAPAVTKPTLTVSAPESAPRARQLNVSGTFTSSVPFASSVSLNVLRKDTEHPEGTALPDVVVKSDGTWSLEDTPTVGGIVTYVVTYSGDAEHHPTTSSAAASISRNTPSLTLRPKTATYPFGKKVTFTAHLGSTYKNRKLELWVDPYGEDRPSTLVRSGAVNGNGDMSWTVSVRHTTVVRAVYSGDAQTAPRAVAVTANARVGIRVAMARQYKTAKIGSQKYYWFHKRTAPVVRTTMSSYPGRAVRLDLQVRVKGSWRSSGHDYFDLSSSGRVSVTIGAPNRTGIKARVRSSYIRKNSGDSANTTTYGAWTYLYWSK